MFRSYVRVNATWHWVNSIVKYWCLSFKSFFHTSEVCVFHWYYDISSFIISITPRWSLYFVVILHTKSMTNNKTNIFWSTIHIVTYRSRKPINIVVKYHRDSGVIISKDRVSRSCQKNSSVYRGLVIFQARKYVFRKKKYTVSSCIQSALKTLYTHT